MLWIELWLALAAMTCFIPRALMTPFVLDRVNLQAGRRIEQIRAMGGDVLAAEDAVGAVSSFDRIRRVFSLRLIILQLKFALKASLNLLDHVADLTVLGVGGLMVIHGETQIGVVVAFLSGLRQLRSPWRTLISYFRILSNARLHFGMIRDRVDVFK